MSAIRKDNAPNVEELLSAGLDVNAVQGNGASIRGFPVAAGSTLLYWTAVYNALKCALVSDLSVEIETMTIHGIYHRLLFHLNGGMCLSEGVDRSRSKCQRCQ